MTLPESVRNAIIDQIKNELQSHYVYLGMSAHFEGTPYRGFAKWMLEQSKEEYGHAMKLYDYLRARNAKISLRALDAPAASYSDTPLDVFEKALAQEQKVTQQINDIYALAQQEKDFATLQFLAWFLQEQVEEENTVSDLIDRLRLAGTNPAALLVLDDESSRRSGAVAAE